MLQQTGVISAEHLWRMPHDDRRRYELVAGKLLEMSPPGARHGLVVARLAAALSVYVDAGGLGVVLSGDPGFKLASNPDTVRGPDIAFVRAARVRVEGVPVGYWTGAPDLVVEVLSPTDRLADLVVKLEQYVQAGAVEAWVVDPERARVTVYRAGASVIELGSDEAIDGGSLLPGFCFPLARLFAARPA